MSQLLAVQHGRAEGTSVRAALLLLHQSEDTDCSGEAGAVRGVVTVTEPTKTSAGASASVKSLQVSAFNFHSCYRESARRTPQTSNVCPKGRQQLRYSVKT